MFRLVISLIVLAVLYILARYFLDVVTVGGLHRLVVEGLAHITEGLALSR